MSLGALRLAGTNLQAAGDHNQRVVLHCIRVGAPTTKSDIARITGLTHPAVTNICRRLMDEGLVVAAGQRRGGRGQPATWLEVNPDGAFSLGLNVDRDHVTLVLVDFVGAVRARRSWDVTFPLPGQVRDYVARMLPELVAEAAIDRARLAGAGVALPDELGDIALPGRTDDFRSWNGVSPESLFPPDFGLAVTVENDAAAAAIGEMHFGLGKRHSSFFYLLLSYGLGGGLVIDSLYRRGATGRSGEIGFLEVGDGEGARVPLQSIVSLSGLYRLLSDAGARNLTPDEQLFADLDERGQAAVEQWITAASEALVEPLVSVACLIDPERVLIGGRLPQPLVDRLVAETNRRLAAHRARMPAVPAVLRADLARDASAVGAAILPFGDMLMPSGQAPGAVAPHSIVRML